MLFCVSALNVLLNDFLSGFQVAEVAVPRELSKAILERIGRLWLEMLRFSLRFLRLVVVHRAAKL